MPAFYQSQNEQVAEGSSSGGISEFVVSILKFLSGHTVSVGYKTGS